MYNLAKSFKGSKGTEENPVSPERKKSKGFLKQLKAMIEKDLGTSMKKLATNLNMQRITVLRAIHEDLQCKSYILKVRQMLSDAMKARRLERSELLITSLKHRDASQIRFFSDKIFCVDVKISHQNDRRICKDPADIPVIGAAKFPARVHVLEVISNEEDVMPPQFFGKGQNMMKEVYLDVMKTMVKPWMVQVAAGKPWLYQQDRAPAHTSKLVQTWCDENLDMFWSKEFWPPSSPDLNPSDSYLWGILERGLWLGTSPVQ